MQKTDGLNSCGEKLQKLSTKYLSNVSMLNNASCNKNKIMIILMPRVLFVS